MSSIIQFRLSKNDSGNQTLVAYVNGQLTDPIDDTHPNFTAIVGAAQGALRGEEIDTQEFLDLFDVAAAVQRKFQRLGNRVSVKGDQILFDGDPVTGPLEDQILDFLNKGEDFAPLVAFYEELANNPLGNVREGLFTWIKGQKAEGNFTIAPDGSIYGYKSVLRRAPEWRAGETEVFVPSQPSLQADIVNGLEVPVGKFIEQVVGDVVEMPRSKVLNEPSSDCGDGLHIGTWAYAKGFYGGETVMLVKFSPRDIVSLPDSNSSWKLRVCRYEIVDVVTEPLEAAVYGEVPVQSDQGPDVDLSLSGDDIDWADGLRDGDVITDLYGNQHIVLGDQDDPDYDDEFETVHDYIHVDNIDSVRRPAA